MIDSFYKQVPKQENLNLTTINKTISCASCEKDLVRSVQIVEIPEPMDYIFTCPHCGGKSFKNKFSFKAHFEPIGCSITSVDYNEKEKLCLVNLKL